MALFCHFKNGPNYLYTSVVYTEYDVQILEILYTTNLPTFNFH